MASHGQTQSDLVAGSVSVPHTFNAGSPLTHNAIDGHVPFPLSLPISPLQAGDAHRNQPKLSNTSVCDLNVPFDMNHTFGDFIFPNDFPFLDYPGSDFPGMGFDMTTGSGCQRPTTMMNSYPSVNSFSSLESSPISDTVRLSSESRTVIGKFHRMPIPEERQSNRNQQAEMNRTAPNFMNHTLGRQNTGIVSESNDDQVRLGGRFLSLGGQNNSAVSTKSTAYRGVPGNTFESPFSPHDQVGNYSYGSTRGQSTSFQNNIHDLGTPLDISGNLTLAQSNSSDFQTMPSLGVNPVPVLPGGQVNMPHLLPAPRRKATEQRKETGLRIPSHDPFENQARRVPFNSSVLRTNHQNAADPPQKSYVRTNIVKQDESDQGAAAVTNKGQFSQSSIPVTKEPPKRTLDSPEQVMMKYQRRKILGQSTSQPFSSHLLQNALGQITAGQPMSQLSTPGRSPHYVNAALRSSVVNDTTMNPTFPATSWAEGPAYTMSMSEHPSTLGPVFMPPTQISNIPFFPYSAMNSQPTFANNSSISVVSPAGAMLNPVYTYAPSIHVHPSISAAQATLPNTAYRHTGVINPVTHSRKGVNEAFLPSSNISSPVGVPQKASLPRINSNFMSSSVNTLRRSSHALAKASPRSVALQSSPTTSHIKWQVSDSPPTLGSKCMLCKRDLSYTPEGPITVPSIAPPVAVLPCGHTFHDHCLQLITPSDQSKDPPCIPCAVGEN